MSLGDEFETSLAGKCLCLRQKIILGENLADLRAGIAHGGVAKEDDLAYIAPVQALDEALVRSEVGTASQPNSSAIASAICLVCPVLEK